MKIPISIIFTFLSFFLYGQSNLEKKIIYYKLGQTQLTKNDQLELNNWYKGIDKIDIENISISGYADSTGNKAINLKYSKYRAVNITNYFISIGVPDSLIIVNYYGESKSPFPSSNQINNEQNRCVVIQIKEYKNSLSKNDSNSSDTSLQDKTISNSLKFENDTIFSFPDGTIIEVDAGTFYPIKIRDVKFKVTEIFTLCDMLKNNTTTRATNGDCLTSAGMLYVKAIYDGVEIQPNKKKYVRIKLPALSKTLDKEMSVYGKFKDKNGEIIWDKIESKLSYDLEGERYYLFETDTLFGFNLDKPIGVKCEKNGPLVKVSRLKEIYIVQIYPNEKYLAVAEQRTKKKFALDELKYDKSPYLIVIAKDKSGFPFIAEGKLDDLLYRKWTNKYIIKRKYFKKLLRDYTGNNSPEDYMCEHLEKIK